MINIRYIKKPNCSSRQNGVALLEVLAAIALLMVLCTAFIPAWGTATKLSVESQMNQKSKNLAEIILQKLIEYEYSADLDPYPQSVIDGFIPVDPPSEHEYDGFSARISVSYPKSPDPNLQLVTVTISQGGKDRRILSGYKLNQ